MRRHTFLVYSNNFKYFNALQKFFNNYTSLFTHSYSIKKTLLSWIKIIFYVWTLAKNSMLCCFVQTFSLKYWRKNLQTHIEYSCHHSIFNLSAKYNKNWHQRNAFWLWFSLNSSYLFRKFKRKSFQNIWKHIILRARWDFLNKRLKTNMVLVNSPSP